MEYFQFFLSHKKNSSLKKGQSLIELLLVIGLSAILLPALLTGFVASREGKAQHGQRTQAVALLKTTVEAVRSVREKGWSNLPANGIYHPEVSGSSWSLVAGEYEDPVTGFKTKVEISNMNRGTCPGPDCGKIVTTGGTTDPSTKKAVGTISWNLPYPSSINSTFYITRYLNNNASTETTEAEFNAGTKTDTQVTNTGGGAVQLAPGADDWCNPNLNITALNLAKNGVANAVTAIAGRAFAGTGDTASGESFANINITDTNPPSASVIATFSNYKTNDVFGEANYGYIATDTNSKEIVIIQIANTPYTEVGYFDAPGSIDANSVFIVGNTGYMTQGNILRNFNLASCSGGSHIGSCPAIDTDGAAISATGTSVVVSGNHAFVSIAGHARELEIFDISDPANIIRVGWADVNGEAANDVFVKAGATRAYIVTNASSTLPEFFIIDTTNKNCSDCPDVGVYNAGTSTNLKAVDVVDGDKKAIIVGQGGEEYQVIKIDQPTNEANPVRCGGMEVNLGIKDIASVVEADGDAYSYIVTGDVDEEFKIVKGGPGGVTASGTFESRTIDPGYEAAFNRFDVSVDRSTDTNIEFQVAVKPGVGGSCTGVTFSSSDFVGPSGTNSTKFQTAVTAGTEVFRFAVPPIINPGQCFRYKAYLSTTASSASPVFYDITVNYSP